MDLAELRHEDQDPETRCPHCGMTRRELYDQGHMGCARCYDVFHTEVARALKEIHGEIEHIGKRF